MNNTFTNVFTRLAATALMLLFFSSLLTAQLSVSVSATSVSCNGGSDGAALANPNGGIPPYNYSWSNNQNTQQIDNLPAGAYTVTVTDSAGATAIGAATINQPFLLAVTAFSTSQICDVAPDGSTTAVPFGGTPPYSYLWSNGFAGAQNNGLAAGDYGITVTDNHGCTASATAAVDYFGEGLWLTPHSTDASCGQASGTASVTVMSGAPPYAYLWSTGATGEEIGNLAPGVYSVTVTDANGCTNQVETIVNFGTAFSMTPEISFETCLNAHDGAINLHLNGGQPPYDVLWSTGATTEQISNLSVGNYTVTVSDNGACSSVATIWVSSIYNGSCGDTTTAIIDSCNLCPLFIPDGGVFNMPINISCALDDDLSSPAQGLCAVHLKFDHEYVGDLTVRLYSPAGQSVQLVGPVGFFGATDFTEFDVLFVSCASPAAPDPGRDSVWTNNYPFGLSANFNGNYYPYMGCLEDFNSGPVNGTWTLEIVDNQSVDVGNLYDVDLIFCEDTAIDSCGNTAPPPMVTATFTYTVSNDSIFCFGNLSNQIGFVWTFNNGSQTSTLLNPVFVANGPGAYPITLAAWNSVDTVYASAVATVVASASSDPNNSTAWNVSPNPFSDQLVVNSKALSAGLANYLLTDALGQAIRQGVLSGNRMEIDTRELPAGAYFICIETENGREARKVIKL